MLVTIYLPTKNRVNLLRRAVDSVLSQTYANIELIVIDDGSSDETSALLSSIRAGDARLKIITNSVSVGSNASRNSAIQAATGDFITGLDDDDAFEPYRIEKFVEAWISYRQTGVEVGFLYSQEKNIIDNEFVGTTSKHGSVVLEMLLETNTIGNQIFAPKSTFIESGLFDVSLPAWQDMEFFMRVIKKGFKGRLVDLPSYIFDITPRKDRISKNEDKIRKAYHIVTQRHFALNRRAKQLMFMQVFNSYYKNKPTIRDFFYLQRLGFWPGGFVRLLRARLNN